MGITGKSYPSLPSPFPSLSFRFKASLSITKDKKRLTPRATQRPFQLREDDKENTLLDYLFSFQNKNQREFEARTTFSDFSDTPYNRAAQILMGLWRDCCLG